MKDDFLAVRDHLDLANWFGHSYSEFSKTLYGPDNSHLYRQFNIPKKNGGFRVISSPSVKLRQFQILLSEVLYEIYPERPSAFGFIRKKNIVLNAQKHINKRYVFNLDLTDFFGSIHFGRVKYLFKSSPFNFSNSVATLLAHIACFDNKLPQGSPASPIISNMIAFKLDTQLQNLARLNNATYTRYADDITFSFTCSKRRLPNEIVSVNGGQVEPGKLLASIISNNGFGINQSKVRLAGRGARMEVTGLTVNEFPNVTRKFIRNVSSMLYAWDKHGYELAEAEYNRKYNKKYRGSGVPPSFVHVIKGKIAFLRSVRGGKDSIFNKLAERFNHLVQEEGLKFKIWEITDPIKRALNSIWIIESESNESATEEYNCFQGTGFNLKDVGLITCAHVVHDDSKNLFPNIVAYKHDDINNKYPVKVLRSDWERDISICTIENAVVESNESTISRSELDIEQGMDVLLIGFPTYRTGQTPYIKETKIPAIIPHAGVMKFEIATLIQEGNSGGPIVDVEGRLLGVALEGATKSSGKNGVLAYTEIARV